MNQQKWLEKERDWWCALDSREAVEKRLERKGTLPFCVRIASNGDPCLSVRQLDGTFVHSKFSVNVKSGACSIIQKGSTVNATSLRGMLEALGYVEAPPPPEENLCMNSKQPTIATVSYLSVSSRCRLCPRRRTRRVNLCRSPGSRALGRGQSQSDCNSRVAGHRADGRLVVVVLGLRSTPPPPLEPIAHRKRGRGSRGRRKWQRRCGR